MSEKLKELLGKLAVQEGTSDEILNLIKPATEELNSLEENDSLKDEVEKLKKENDEVKEKYSKLQERITDQLFGTSKQKPKENKDIDEDDDDESKKGDQNKTDPPKPEELKFEDLLAKDENLYE